MNRLKDYRWGILWLICLMAIALPPFWLTAPVQAQSGQNVVISQGPPIVPYQKLFFYNGSNQLTYTCTANSTVPRQTLSITAATVATPGVFTSASHGFDTSSRPRVQISGTVPTGWSGILGTWVLKPAGANTFSLVNSAGTSLDTSGYSPAWSGTASFTSQAPRTNQPYWAMQWLQYDGSANLTSTMNAYGTGGIAGAKCDDRASDAIEWK